MEARSSKTPIGEVSKRLFNGGAAVSSSTLPSLQGGFFWWGTSNYGGNIGWNYSSGLEPDRIGGAAGDYEWTLPIPDHPGRRVDLRVDLYSKIQLKAVTAVAPIAGGVAEVVAKLSRGHWNIEIEAWCGGGCDRPAQPFTWDVGIASPVDCGHAN